MSFGSDFLFHHHGERELEGFLDQELEVFGQRGLRRDAAQNQG